MPLISDKIMEQMRNIGQPRVSTTTETMKSEEPLDIMQLGLLMMLLLGDKGQSTSALGTTPVPPSNVSTGLVPGAANLVGQAPGSLSPNAGIGGAGGGGGIAEILMKLLGGLGGGGGGLR